MNGDMIGLELVIAKAGLDRFMPMHLLVATDGRVIGMGPTLARVFEGVPTEGAVFQDLFEIRFPGGAVTVSEIMERASLRFRLAPRHRARLGLRGLAVRLPGSDMVLLNLTFGIDLIAAVRDFSLTDADFATTDLAMELLYLAEANAAVTRELRGLNLRLEGARMAAEEEASTDRLTGLRNRRAADLYLERMIGAAAPFGLLHIDLDYFKAVNDTLGHAAGDFVLETVGRVLSDHVRADDCAARIGGDEFVVVLPNRIDPDILRGVAARIIARVSQPMTYAGQPVQVAASIGIVRSVDFPASDLPQLLAAADRALYAAKHAGRSQAVLIGPEEA
jgi:diguanylate cyclase (GGDEF)-like protein